MFNLLVRYDIDGWDGTPYHYETSRAAREYTEENLTQRFSSFTDEAISELKRYPCLLAYETRGANDTPPAKIGWLKIVRKRQSNVAFEYEIDDSFPAISANDIGRLAWHLDIQGMEMHRTHWAVKNVDLFTVLIDAGLVDRSIVENLPATRQRGMQPPIADLQARPTVFRVPSTPVEHDLVSVMMPFSGSFNNVYAALNAECASLGLRCQRADEIWNATEVIQDIFSLIYRSRIVVCDFTGRNPNVFYEAGIAHTLGRDVIPITQSNEDIPFDLRHHRYLHYLNNTEGLSALREAIRPRLHTLSSLAA